MTSSLQIQIHFHAWESFHKGRENHKERKNCGVDDVDFDSDVDAGFDLYDDAWAGERDRLQEHHPQRGLGRPQILRQGGAEMIKLSNAKKSKDKTLQS